MITSFLFVLALLWGTEGRVFQNPLIEGFDGPDPGGVFYNGTYYVATTSKRFPIHTSKDLQNWEFANLVFDNDTKPSWGNDQTYWAPEFHILGEGMFRVYFTGREPTSGRLCIGVAYADNILGPYKAQDKPLVLDLSQDILDPTIIYDDDKIHLVWKGSVWMYGRTLAPDGLSFASDQVYQLMRNDLEWESYIIEGPWFQKRNNTFYLFYSGNEYCTNKYAVGVARSSTPFGPYEKKGAPILVSDDSFKGTGHCSIVKDLDGKNDVMLYHAYKADFVCNGNPRLMCAKSMAWGEDGWPYMVNT